MIFNGKEYKNILCVKQHPVRVNFPNYKKLDGKSLPLQEIHMADLVLCFKENEIEVIKDRYGQKGKVYFKNDGEFAKFLLLL